MTVREFIDAVTQNPNFLDLELCIVTNDTGRVNGGQFDGAVRVRSKPIQSVILGNGHLLNFADPNPNTEKEDVYLADITQWPGIVVIGPTPDSLKW